MNKAGLIETKSFNWLYRKIYLVYKKVYEGKFLVKSLKKIGDLDKQIIVDVGAHIGFFTMMAYKYSPKSFFIGFEPDPHNRLNFKRNVAFNAKLEPFAVAAKDSWRSFNIDLKHSGNSRLSQSGSNLLVVRTVSLDNYFKYSQNKIGIIKLDVQGAEYEILKGSAEILLEHKPAIILEIDVGMLKEFGSSLLDITSLLKDFGYIETMTSLPKNKNKLEYYDVLYQHSLSQSTIQK